MSADPVTIDHLSQVISQVVAPSFLLGAVASFVAIISARISGIVDRIRTLNAIPEEGHAQSTLREELPRLRRRVKLLNKSILLTIGSGVVATVLMIAAFANAMLGLDHAWGAAILFMASLSVLCTALLVFAYEVIIAFKVCDDQAN